MHSHSRRHVNLDNFADDNRSVSVQAFCLYCEDDGAQASYPQEL